MANRQDQEENRKSGFAYAAGIALFASVVTFCGLGWMLDKWLSAQPWFLIGGIVIGSAVGLYQFVRISSKTY
ncbi:MAG TPA: AtpZ/AtpI family protein [Pyrinomonadaceae bacterium]|nr:AtpZ/AtpI family protein [Pyrinomonadaceae bacterium]